MINRVYNLQSPFLGYQLEKNGVLEYEADGELIVRIFYSQEQAMEIVDALSANHLSATTKEEFRKRIHRCGLPLSSTQAPEMIRGPAAQFLDMARRSMSKGIVFASDSRERILMYSQRCEKNDPVGIFFAVDETTARHVYIVHGRREAGIALESLQHIGTQHAHELRLCQLEVWDLPEESSFPTFHIEHDAASYLGMRVEAFWLMQRLPQEKNLIPESE